MALIKAKVVGENQVTLASAGTRQALSASERNCRAVIIQADYNNSGKIYIGDSLVTASKCVKLGAGDSIPICAEDNLGDEDFCCVDLNDIYIDGTFTGDKVNIVVLDLSAVSYNRG